MSTSHPTNEAFRDEFRGTVPANYSGLLHGAKILAFGVVALGACFAFMRTPLRWWELAMVAPVLVVWNLLEWHGHRLLHRPGKSALSRALYTRHTLTHHRFFTHEHGSLRDARDLRIVFFPVFALPALTIATLVPAALVWLLLSLNAALVVVATVVFAYLLFEFFHLCAHLPEGAWITRVPIISTMRRHHRAHHDPRLMMSKNMNFTLPLADWGLGTSDLDRGWWGTLFNGESTRHVRRSE